MLNEPLFVLAGGLGTRLRSAVSDVPKPLAPVHNKPFLQYLLEDWREQGASDFVFLIHHQSDLIEDFVNTLFGTSPFRNCRARLVREPTLLGTGGAVANAIRELAYEGTFLLVNADTWLPGSLQSLGDSTEPAMAIVEVNDLSRYGGVTIEAGMVKKFIEKGAEGAGAINAGLYRLSARDFPQTGTSYSLERDILPYLVESGVLSAVLLNRTFIDIGIPEDYAKLISLLEPRI